MKHFKKRYGTMKSELEIRRRVQNVKAKVRMWNIDNPYPEIFVEELDKDKECKNCPYYEKRNGERRFTCHFIDINFIDNTSANIS